MTTQTKTSFSIRAVGHGGLRGGIFHHVDPISDAQFIHGVVWSGINKQWATGDYDRNELRERVVRFCLRGLGVGV